jgi:hypothetical protein
MNTRTMMKQAEKEQRKINMRLLRSALGKGYAMPEGEFLEGCLAVMEGAERQVLILVAREARDKRIALESKQLMHRLTQPD